MLKISILFSALCLFVIGCYVMFNQDLSDIGFGIKIENITPQTASEIRSAFSKNGGSLGETGSLGFVFKRKGVIKFNNEKFDEDAFFEQAADAGAEDIISEKK